MSRAIIPVGYMPDVSHERERLFAVTLCSAAGPATMAVEGSAQHQDEPGQSYPTDTCPYGVVAGYTFMNGHDAALSSGLARTGVSVPYGIDQGLPAFPSRGPPLGSRAPPPYFA